MKLMLEEWITGELSIPSQETNGLPLCPYAQQAWVNDEVRVTWQDIPLWKDVFNEVDKFDDSHKVVICAREESEQTYEELEHYCFALNAMFAHQGRDIWLLAFLAGDYTMIFIQRLSHLDSAAAWLEKLGYYKNYDSEDYNRLIAARRSWRKYDEEKTYA